VLIKHTLLPVVISIMGGDTLLNWCKCDEHKKTNKCLFI